MGNERSQPLGLEVGAKAVAVTDSWLQYDACAGDSRPLSVFKGGESLERCSANLMVHRHPCIVRFVSRWREAGGTHCLATEPVAPLSAQLHAQEPLRACVGLHQILQALDFIHTKALQSHNNICISSIYVASDGSWKLGGLEFLKPFKELNHAYLKQLKNIRYANAIDANEETSDDLKTIDQFAFYTLIEDIFKGKTDDQLPNLTAFKKYCKKELQNPIPGQRISFASLLNHEFFNQEFLSIHKFLTSLPVKSEHDKRIFFNGLLDKLRNFDERTAAAQLGVLLLSRLVLLNSTAREKLLPYLLKPKENSSDDEGFFTVNVFKEYISPQLLKMFKVRDTQVRMLLLKHFIKYMSIFNEEELSNHILPELLLGIKDTDDNLVSMTLYCLADLIPVLGAATVIGPRRKKIFSDGRPMVNSKLASSVQSFSSKNRKFTENLHRNRQQPKIPTDETSLLENSLNIQNSSFGSKESIDTETNPYLHERPSPDGGEDLDDEVVLNKITDNTLVSDDDEWSDWEQNEHNNMTNTNNGGDVSSFASVNESATDKNEPTVVKTSSDRTFLQNAAIEAKSKTLTDIAELDIKNQKYSGKKNPDGTVKKDEFDFFTDMEPVIEKANVLTVSGDSVFFQSNNAISKNLSFVPTETDVASAWDDTDWADD